MGQSEWSDAITPEIVEKAVQVFEVGSVSSFWATAMRESMRAALEAVAPEIVAEHDRLMREAS